MLYEEHCNDILDLNVYIRNMIQDAFSVKFGRNGQCALDRRHPRFGEVMLSFFVDEDNDFWTIYVETEIPSYASYETKLCLFRDIRTQKDLEEFRDYVKQILSAPTTMTQEVLDKAKELLGVQFIEEYADRYTASLGHCALGELSFEMEYHSNYDLGKEYTITFGIAVDYEYGRDIKRIDFSYHNKTIGLTLMRRFVLDYLEQLVKDVSFIRRSLEDAL
jgi:hypothetical protein